MDKNSSLHENHRSRMRKKYLRFSADSFESHQLLELLLYHSIQRQDTNPTAHRLLLKMGSLENILKAPIAELKSTTGIGEISALQLSLAGAVSRKAELDAACSSPLDSEFRRSRYLFNWYKGKPAGTVAALMLDSQMRLIEDVTLSAGRMFRSESYCSSITDAARQSNAVNVILSHSHSNGVRTPSVEDIYLTGAIRAALAVIEVELVEHYIVTDTDCIACSSTAPDCTVK